MLVASAIEKSFGSNRVLNEANLTLASGQVHALLGANGAGKSTLSRIVAGHIHRDRGSILLNDREVDFRTPRDALQAGVSIVMQETSLAPDLSVLDNIFLPSFSMPARLSRRGLRQKAESVIARLGQAGSFSLDQDVSSLSAAQRQLVEIAKALALDAEVIIFDEPTASLSPREVDRLFALINQLRQDKHAIGFVSHRLEEVLTLTDRVTVLRDGRSVGESLPTQELNQTELIRLMVGQELGAVYTSRPQAVHQSTPVVLEVEHLACPPLVQDVSFRLHAGEIMGLGGLVGSGRSETVETIFGLRARTGGSIRLNGVAFHAAKPADALQAGIALVPEDRRRQSIIPDFTVAENLMLGHLSTATGIGLGFRALQTDVNALLDMLDVSPRRLAEPSLLNFSGGMQQKIIIARWLLLKPKVLILDEPTKGIDISTRASIYDILHKVADQGVSILVISSDFEELLGICERITVISDGATIADVPSALLNEEQLTLLAAPRTSMAYTQAFLQSLASDYAGYSFWALVDDQRLICLADGWGAGPPGSVRPMQALRPGNVVNIADVAIGRALAGPRGVFAPVDDGGAIVMDVHTARGHGNGVIGLVVPDIAPRPAAADVCARITAAFAQMGT